MDLGGSKSFPYRTRQLFKHPLTVSIKILIYSEKNLETLNQDASTFRNSRLKRLSYLGLLIYYFFLRNTFMREDNV